jgi:hypothetical protein
MLAATNADEQHRKATLSIHYGLLFVSLLMIIAAILARDSSVFEVANGNSSAGAVPVWCMLLAIAVISTAEHVLAVIQQSSKCTIFTLPSRRVPTTSIVSPNANQDHSQSRSLWRGTCMAIVVTSVCQVSGIADFYALMLCSVLCISADVVISLCSGTTVVVSAATRADGNQRAIIRLLLVSPLLSQAALLIAMFSAIQSRRHFVYLAAVVGVQLEMVAIYLSTVMCVIMDIFPMWLLDIIQSIVSMLSRIYSLTAFYFIGKYMLIPSS